MSASSGTAFTAYRVGDRLRPRAEAPWEVYGERLRRYEIHLSGQRVEMTRGPIHLEGYGVRVFRPDDGRMRVGFFASNDLGDAGIDAALEAAESAGRFSRFPAPRVELPSAVAAHAPPVENADPDLWARPLETLEAYRAALAAAFEGRHDEVLSFGSLKANLIEVTLTNSEGIQRQYHHTTAEVEFAVKATGGPAGAAAGEYWVNDRRRRLDPRGLADAVATWCRRAQDVRRASPPPSGPTTVVLPPSVLADVLPAILGYRFSGAAELRKMAPPVGSRVGSDVVSITDDGTYPFGLGTAPFDDEGVPQARRPLIERGTVAGGLYDLLYASALGRSTTASGRRDSLLFVPWFHFDRAPTPEPTTIVVAPGTGGSDEELAEAAGEGLWVDQLGYAFPDPASSAWGGEIRAAYRIHGGKIAEPVRGGTLGGVVLAPEKEPSVLGGARAVGRTPELRGALASPPWLIDGLVVAGD